MSAWLPKVFANLEKDPTYAKAAVDEWWQSLPMPEVAGKQPSVVIFTGPSTWGAGGPTPEAPVLMATAPYPSAKVVVQPPPPDYRPTEEDAKVWDDPRVLERARAALATRGDDTIRHQELLDEFLQKGWWSEREPHPGHHAVAQEWDGILTRLLLPNYEWLYRHCARQLRQWIAANR